MEGIPKPEDLVDGRLDSDAKSKLEKLIAHNANEEGQRDSNHSSGKVSIELCQLMKELYDDGLSYRQITEACPFSSVNTVKYHVKDRCSHTERVKLTYSECGWIRFKAKQGKSAKELSEKYDVTRKAIKIHAKGECNHEHECPTVTTEELEANNKDRFMAETTCPVCGDTFKHKRYKDRTTCSKSCGGKLAGQASAEANEVQSD